MAAALLAGALVVAGAEAGPGGEMSVGGKTGDVCSHLGQDRLCGASADAGNSLEVGEGMVKRAKALLDLAAEAANGLIQVGDMGQVLADHQPLVVTDLSLQRPLQLRLLLTEIT